MILSWIYLVLIYIVCRLSIHSTLTYTRTRIQSKRILHLFKRRKLCKKSSFPELDSLHTPFTGRIYSINGLQLYFLYVCWLFSPFKSLSSYLKTIFQIKMWSKWVELRLFMYLEVSAICIPRSKNQPNITFSTSK